MRITTVFIAVLAAISVGCASASKTASTTPNVATPAVPAKASLAVPAPAKPAPALVDDKAKYACLRGQETRSVKIEMTAPKGCKVFYSTHGNTDPVAWSTTGTSHCESVSSKIRTNLESAGFKCEAGEAVKAVAAPKDAANKPAAPNTAAGAAGVKAAVAEPAAKASNSAASVVPAKSSSAAAPAVAEPVKAK
ncbi:MAG: hypothetical protein KF799_12575 [Bdellovibrionales bacterium]|nr:hypothetical protein [Bdellovibrionales bacterium]